MGTIVWKSATDNNDAKIVSVDMSIVLVVMRSRDVWQPMEVWLVCDAKRSIEIVSESICRPEDPCTALGEASASLEYTANADRM